MLKPPMSHAVPQTVTIEGQAIPVTYELVSVDEVQLDPENPRIKEQLKKLGIKGTPTQTDLRELILNKISGVQGLIRRIRVNGGLQEPIYVRADGRVAEGNCRTAVYRFLRDSKNKDKSWQTIPALRLPPSVTERQIAVLQGDLHVAGKITWRAQEQAGHLHYMNTSLGMQPGEIASAIALAEVDVTRILQAYGTMTNSIIPRMKNANGLDKYSYVYEFYKNTKLKNFRAKPSNIKLFTDLVVGEKFKRGSDVRNLYKIVDSPKALEALKKDGFATAIALVGKSDPTADSAICRKMKSMTKALASVRKPDIERIRSGSKERTILQELFNALKHVADVADVKLK